MSQINTENLTLAYDGRVVLSDLSFSVERGDYVCIIGENGSGKSTLVRALLGLKHPLSGKIAFGDGLCRRDIGYIPQKTDVERDFPATVREVVMSGLVGEHVFPSLSKNCRARAAAAMDRLGITDIKDRPITALSGGQRQRVLLARAMCASGKLLVLDEPATGLDVLITAQLYDILSELNRNDSLTVIMVSHDIPAAMKYATKILHLGTPGYFFGTAAEYRESEIGRKFLENGRCSHERDS